MHSGCCSPPSHPVSKSDTLGMRACDAILGSESCKSSFMHLFPRLKVISAPNATMAWNMITGYQNTLTCLTIDSVSWSRTEPAVFPHLTCLSVRDVESIRWTSKTFPNLVSLRTESCIDQTQVIDLLPASLQRLHCHLMNMNRLLRLNVAKNLTHLRLTLSVKRNTFRAGHQLSFPSLKFLCIHDENEWIDSPSHLITVLSQQLLVPQLQWLCISGPRTSYELADMRQLMSHLPPLHAVGVDYYSNPVEFIDILHEFQPDISILYSSIFSDADFDKGKETYDKLCKFASLNVFGSALLRLFSPRNQQNFVNFLEHHFANQLKELEVVDGIPLNNDVYEYSSLPDPVCKEMDRLKHNQLHVFSVESGSLSDAFIMRMNLMQKRISQ